MSYFRSGNGAMGDLFSDLASAVATGPTAPISPAVPVTPTQPSGLQQAASLLATIAPHQAGPYPYPYPYPPPSTGIGTGTLLLIGGGILAAVLLARR